MSAPKLCWKEIPEDPHITSTTVWCGDISYCVSIRAKDRPWTVTIMLNGTIRAYHPVPMTCRTLAQAQRYAEGDLLECMEQQVARLRDSMRELRD